MKGLSAAKVLLPLVGAGLVLCACWDRLAGNGSEVENAVVAGRVVSPDGTPAAGALVALVPSGYDPINDPSKPVFHKTNAAGSYSFRAYTGTYNIYGVQPGNGRTFLAQNLAITGADRWDVGTDTLRAPGRIRLSLPEGSWTGAYVYVPGTPIVKAVGPDADSARVLVMDSLPAGTYSLVLARKDDPDKRMVVTQVPVASEAVTELPYSPWRRSALLRIDPAAAGAAIRSDVTSLPVLLRLEPANFDFATSHARGADLRVTSDAGRVLPHRIQSWDSASASALVWVKVDTVFAGHPTRLRLYWGNDTAAAPSDNNVFSMADGYRGVWHLDAPPAGTPSGFPDEGPAGDSAFAQGAITGADTVAGPDTGVAVSRADGVLGRGAHFNGKNSWLIGGKQYSGPAGYSYAFWFKTATKEGGKILAFVMPGLHGTIPGRPGNFNFDRVTWMDNDGFVRFGFTIASLDSGSIGSWQAFVSAKRYNDGQWHHLACSVSDARALLNIDGEKVVDYTGTMRALSINGLWRLAYAGDGMWDPMWTSEYFRGSLDEVRLIHAPRSEDWLRLDYAAQRAGSKLVSLEAP